MKKKKKITIKHLIVLAIAIYIFLAIFKQRALMRDLTAKKDELSEEIHLLEEDIENLENNIANSNSVEFIEKTARDELGMVKPREIIYVDKNKNKTKNNR